MAGGGIFPDIPDWRIYKVGPHIPELEQNAWIPGLVMRSGGLTEEILEWQTDQSSSGDCCPEDSSLVLVLLLSLQVQVKRYW